jgi:pyridoxamine-phosphate oxidase
MPRYNHEHDACRVRRTGLRQEERFMDHETETTLTDSQFEAGTGPFSLFQTWFAEAERAEINDPNAMALATVDETGLPNVRMVLLKGWDEDGFTFFTNLESAKGREIQSSMKAAMVMHWKSLRRQVRVRGDVTPVSDVEADEYYATRARGSRIGAWASKQSRPLEGRLRWRSPWPNTPRAMRWAISRAPRIGRGSGSIRSRLSSGRTASSGCTTGSASPGRPPAENGRGRGFIPDACAQAVIGYSAQHLTQTVCLW